MDREFQLIQARHRARRWIGENLLKAHRAKYGTSTGLVLVHDQPEVERRPWYAVVLLPHPEGCRRAWFDEWGFSGHDIYKSFEEAAADSYVEGFRRTDPGLLDRVGLTPRFQAGVTWSLLPESERWTTSPSAILEKMQGA